MAFVNVPFPPRIAMGSTGGPTWRTTVVRLDSGHEQRNQHWSGDLGQWDAGSHIRTAEELDEVLAFFNNVGGMANGFLWQDRFDFAIVDQVLGTGDGVTAAFQIFKRYLIPGTGFFYDKTLSRPIAGTVRISVAGTLKTEGTHYTVAYATGLVTFTGGNIPTLGQALTISCHFYKPARFDVDTLTISYADLHQGTIQLPIVELRP
jgi:uncharacterized protein (TIGR02217 family)